MFSKTSFNQFRQQLEELTTDALALTFSRRFGMKLGVDEAELIALENGTWFNFAHSHTYDSFENFRMQLRALLEEYTRKQNHTDLLEHLHENMKIGCCDL